MYAIAAFLTKIKNQIIPTWKIKCSLGSWASLLTLEWCSRLLGMALHTCDSSTWGVEPWQSGNGRHIQLRSKFKTAWATGGWIKNKNREGGEGQGGEGREGSRAKERPGVEVRERQTLLKWRLLPGPSLHRFLLTLKLVPTLKPTQRSKPN